MSMWPSPDLVSVLTLATDTRSRLTTRHRVAVDRLPRERTEVAEKPAREYMSVTRCSPRLLGDGSFDALTRGDADARL
jgi:hypothetical protein